MPNGWGRSGSRREPLGRKLARIDRRARAAGPAASQDVAITRTSDGWSFDATDLGGGGVETCMAVISDAGVAARASMASPYTMGKGTAYVCSLTVDTDGDAIAATGTQLITVYNSTLSTIAAGQLVQLKTIGGAWFVDVADC